MYLEKHRGAKSLIDLITIIMAVVETRFKKIKPPGGKFISSFSQNLL
jgi:hypothetical protein